MSIEIDQSREARAPIERMWKLISDVVGEQKYWPDLKHVKILSRNGDSVEREASISRGPLGDAKSTHTFTTDSHEKSTTVKFTKGPLIGTRKIRLIPVSNSQTRIDVNWHIEMPGVPAFALGFARDTLSRGTEKALAQIAADAEEAAEVLHN